MPVDEDLRRKLAQKAEELGFDSIQAMLRYVSKAIVDGRKVTFGQAEPWGPPPKHVLDEWERESEDIKRQLKTGEAKVFDNVEDFLTDLKG